MSEIWKLQWPLFASASNPPVMAYREGRRQVKYVPCTDQLADLFGDANKIFVEAHLDEAGTLVVDRRVKDQDW